jgi:hypothetical protein
MAFFATKNQYINKSELSEEVVFEEDYEHVSMIDLTIPEDGEEYVLIYNSYYTDGDEYINIYSRVNTVYTTYECMNEDKYKKLPAHIERVNVFGYSYDVKNDFEMMKFMTKGTFEHYVRSVIIPNEKFNDFNSRGQTALYIASKFRMTEIINELIGLMTRTAINKKNIKNMTALHICIRNRMKPETMRLLAYLTEEEINDFDDIDNNLLIASINSKMFDVAMLLNTRTTEKTINELTTEYSSVLSSLIYSHNTQSYFREFRHEIDEDFIIDVIRKTNEETINRIMDDTTLFIKVCRDRMTRVAEEMARIITKKTATYETRRRESAIQYIKRNKMESVREILVSRGFM